MLSFVKSWGRWAMVDEWRESTWGEEISLEYGKAIRGYNETRGKYRVFGSNGPIGWTDNALAEGPGVILGRKGAYRGVQFWREPFWVIDTAYYVVPKTELDMRWLYYAIKHYKLGEIDDGSPIPSTTRAAVYVQELAVPSPEEQRSIADVLGTLDDRIDNLRQTNATLEAIAAALFKSWFVDFDGVPATDMQESELGLIPKGWRVGSVYDISEVRYGAPFSSSKFNTVGDGLPLVRIRDLRNEKPGVWTLEIHPKGYLIQPGDIIVGMDGEFRAYLWGGEPAWMNQRICAFHPKSPYCAAFVHNVIAPHLARVEETEVATTVIHLGKSDIDEFRVIIPSDEVAAKFEALCQPLYDRIVTGKQQAATLAALRNTLLPRLISGQLRVNQ
ncbi:restriction endonuclease subunit S [Xanthomonas citri pv. anacardii]|uniref:restriction endonuclease subunit S n=1 Tax=Xanthomonas citri TaxID=346 RepID=UPI002155503A|nr:restriction endonuclease subunit S [Xanthomonas citri]MCT8357467.1 restriction endonuclease subunit S [Xanthomonas citri pv. anacardii]MCT8361547.1 restriction endonuclease subunit S [Xanthomonas citri pv. anacardii]MCT8369491.1 restriction endonuclease subunit S [Xanthomonas citri pv. anacardii]MCT8373527.1 restriction endonuclease subunit S [Xanthomonas citri pv. anacardii]MCT8377612.1 restriction endonuclease subunit S [Xanthomonas citri pv. anacardii]